jgi:hypothetical protein
MEGESSRCVAEAYREQMMRLTVMIASAEANYQFTIILCNPIGRLTSTVAF